MIKNNQNGKPFAVANILALTGTLTANALANALPINGKTTGELSDLYPNYFTPAGVTFSIWGVIYFFLFAFAIYQAVILFKLKQPEAARIYSISPYFIANCILNASWIFAWHYQYVALSVVIIIGMLVTLIIIHQKLGLPYSWTDAKNKFFTDVPFSLYLGWITIATVANLTVLFTTINWDGGPFSPSSWTQIMIAAGTLICLAVLISKQNIVYALVVIWAFVGIILKRNETNTPFDENIIACAKVCIGIIVAFVLYTLIKGFRTPAKHTTSMAGQV